MTDPPSHAPSTATEKQQNILRVETKATPWLDAAEFDAVGRGLLIAASLFPSPSGEESSHRCFPPGMGGRAELEESLRRVAVWADRAEGGRLPHAVETSAALAAILLGDAAARDAGPGRGPVSGTFALLATRQAYASAVVRAINGMADASMKNRAGMRPGSGMSVSALCDKLGVPGWIVDLRHDSAHNDLPALPSLRLAAKALLAFLGDRYWAEMARLRGEGMAAALGILARYKAAAKASAVEESAKAAAKIAKAGERRRAKEEAKKNRKSKKLKKDNAGESNGKEDDGKNDGISEFGRFSIFAEPSSQSRKRVTGAPPEECMAPAAAAGPVSETSTISAEPGEADKSLPMPSEKKMESPLHLAQEFLQEVPIDTGLRALMSFLVWGGVGDLPLDRGALIPGSPATIPATPQGFDKIKGRHRQLLVVVASAWTGFSRALLINIVEHILHIEQILQGGSRVDAGFERKLFFLSSWATHLLSREFNANFDPLLASRSQTNLLEKKAWRWTDDQREFMAGSAPFIALKRWKFPLNSLLERVTQGSMSGGDTVSELAKVFEGLVQNGKAPENQKVVIKSNVKLTTSRREEDELNSGAGPISLEAMEAMLSDTEDGPPGHRPISALEGGNPPNSDCSMHPEGEAGVTMQPAWSRVEHWEPCPIGTIPGYSPY